jgi:drug/metabolite transporter (DMT)-like permease
VNDSAKGWWLGFLGVMVFAFTLPFTRMAVGTAESPQLSGVFVALGRASVAALLSLLLLKLTRAPWPRREDWFAIGMTALGVVLGFPLLTSVAMRHVESVHASVMLGILPLATAAIGAMLNRQRPSLGFWLWAVLGAALVIAFALLHNGQAQWELGFADVMLLLATLCAAIGYGYGARLAAYMRAEHVICWALVAALPLTLPLALWTWPAGAVGAPAWFGFGYVSVFSMWAGFFLWYRGLALGGTVRVSQVQLVQPFISMLASVPLLGETLDALTLGFGLAVVASVFLGKRMPVMTRAKGRP